MSFPSAVIVVLVRRVVRRCSTVAAVGHMSRLAALMPANCLCVALSAASHANQPTLLMDVASMLVLSGMVGLSWTRWACAFPYLLSSIAHISCRLSPGGTAAAADLGNALLAAPLWVLLNSLLRLPLRDRLICAAGHVMLCIGQQPTLLRAAPSAIAAVCFGEALGAALLHLESVVVSLSVAEALQHSRQESEAQRQQSTKDLATLATLAPTIPWERIELLHQIGHGAYGSVHAVRHLGTLAAIKIVHRGKADIATLRAECELMLSLRHPHVLLTIGLVSDGQERHAILTELMSRSLAQLLVDAHQELEWASPLTRIALQTAQAMAYLHGHGVIHGDLKPANILLGRSPLLHAKICDFGEARRLEQSPGGSFLRIGGVLASQSPQRADVWTFGGLLIHMERRSPPFNPAPHMPWLMSMARGDMHVSARWPTAVADLAMRCALPTGFAARGARGQECGDGSGADGRDEAPSPELSFEGCVSALMTISVALGTMSPAPGAGSSFIKIGSGRGGGAGGADGAGSGTSSVLDLSARSDQPPHRSVLGTDVKSMGGRRLSLESVGCASSDESSSSPFGSSESCASFASTVLAQPASTRSTLPPLSGGATPFAMWGRELPVASEWCSGRASAQRSEQAQMLPSHPEPPESAFRRRKEVPMWSGVGVQGAQAERRARDLMPDHQVPG